MMTRGFDKYNIAHAETNGEKTTVVILIPQDTPPLGADIRAQMLEMIDRLDFALAALSSSLEDSALSLLLLSGDALA